MFVCLQFVFCKLFVYNIFVYLQIDCLQIVVCLQYEVCIQSSGESTKLQFVNKPFEYPRICLHLSFRLENKKIDASLHLNKLTNEKLPGQNKVKINNHPKNHSAPLDRLSVIQYAN